MSIQGGPDIVENGLVLCLDAANLQSFVSGSTTWYDLSGFSNHAILENGPTYTGSNKGAIVFDGSNDYAPLATSASFPLGTSPGTICGWAMMPNYNPNTPYQWIFNYGTPSGNQMRAIGVKQDGYVAFDGYGSRVQSPQIFRKDVWYNVVGVYSGSLASLFVNGRLVAGPTAQSWSTVGSASRVARIIGSGGEFWPGRISQVMMYNRALSESEVLQNYNAIKGRFPSPPPNISASFWLPFEFSTLTTASLAANDNSAGSWELNNTRNLLGISGSIAQFTNTGSVNFLSDLGVRGLAYNVRGLAGGGAASNMRFAAPVGINKYSMRFYYYVPYMDWFNSYGIYRGLNGSGFGFTGDGILRHSKNPTDALENIPISTVNAWYRIEVYWEIGGKHIQSVYNTSGELVGTWEGTAGTQTIYFFNFFYETSGNNNATSNAYMDNLIIDWVNAKFPIGP